MNNRIDYQPICHLHEHPLIYPFLQAAVVVLGATEANISRITDLTPPVEDETVRSFFVVFSRALNCRTAGSHSGITHTLVPKEGVYCL